MTEERPAGPTGAPASRVVVGVVVLLLAVLLVILGSGLLVREAAGDPTGTYRELEEAIDRFELSDTYRLVSEDRVGTPGNFAAGGHPGVTRTYISLEPVDAACTTAVAAFEDFASQVAQTGPACSYHGAVGELTASLLVRDPEQGDADSYVPSSSRVDVMVSSGG